MRTRPVPAVDLGTPARNGGPEADSLDNNEVELSAEELPELDDALVEAERAAGRGELIRCDEVLSHVREIS